MQNTDELTPCSRAPHCVSSQADADSPRHIAPLVFAGDAQAAREALLKVLNAIDNARIERADEHFVHATFRSRLGFVDDVTFVVRPQASVIDVKSSSRVGYYDFGANRRRVERLRADFEALLAEG